MGIRGISHMAIRVKDIDRSLAFYQDVLGFAEMFRLNQEDGSLWLVYLRINDTTYLELFPDGVGERAPGKPAVGFNHICLEVTDIEEVIAEMARHDVPLTSPLQTGLDHNRQAWVEDPDGNRIELMEIAPHSLQLRAIERLNSTS